MIYFDPFVFRLRDVETGQFVSGTEEFLEEFFGEDLDDIEDLYLTLKSSSEPKKRKKISKDDAVDRRLKEILEEYEDIMDQEILY